MIISDRYQLKHVVWIIICFSACSIYAEDGYNLWLRYDKISKPDILAQYNKCITEAVFPKSSQIFDAAKEELKKGLSGLLSKNVPFTDSVSKDGAILVGTPETSAPIQKLVKLSDLQSCGSEGYLIRSSSWNGKSVTVIAGNTPQGVLYGTFHFLRLLQTCQNLKNVSVQQKPRIQKRLLNHWDNLDGSVERGYAGKSIWNWKELPDKINPRLKDYARANASIGINGTVLNNVNSQAKILSRDYLDKASVIADILRPYGIRIYFSIKFTSPKEIGGLPTADPMDPGVRRWWKNKAAEIYKIIPDFGGFLVKAYSEGQPGPQQYGRSHADGANMLAEALAPYGGIVMWRSFVYDLSIDSDRTKCAYLEFVPLDGKFASNVLIQTKNGPIDFQPREPFNPLFGSMPKTPLVMELQITQEYTGQAKHLVYLAPQWKEILDSDTFAKGPGTTVAKIVDGSAEGHKISTIAGVSGIGSDRNWTGHHFSQANWYAFGRLAWDPDLSSDQIAKEWIRMTWSNDPEVINIILKMMTGSWEACVNYMTPLGLHHLMAAGHHYGPQPDYVHPGRHDWSSTYYHKADSKGIGFDRSKTGTNAVSQYYLPLRDLWNSPNTCPEKYLLWFHHVPWDYPLASGSTLWIKMQAKYKNGLDYVHFMQKSWNSLKNKIDNERFNHVHEQLEMQFDNAVDWRDTCLEYFGKFVHQKKD